jgi:hypothetical protein
VAASGVSALGGIIVTAAGVSDLAEPAASAGPQPAIPSRLQQLLTRLDQLLAEKYSFDVFAKDSINFGIIVTYRQTWVPQSYQVGDLVSTIPLAPREIRRYTTRQVVKKARAEKEAQDNLQALRTESADTSRVDAEIVDNAHDNTNFNVTATESYGPSKVFNVNSTQTAGGDQGKQSSQTKKDFRESVLRSAQDYKQQHRTEIDTSSSSESEDTTFHELQNPNDELTVTYLFYELQRTYRISERINQLTPVILVANDVPAPGDIDDAWLAQHDWILRRALLDDSFRPALDYLTESFTGAEINIQILTDNAVAQKRLVESLNQQILSQDQILAKDQQDVLSAVQNLGASQEQQGMINIVKRIFDPLGITGQADTGEVSAAQAMVDYAKNTEEQAEREKAQLLSQLQVAATALQAAVDKLSAAVTAHYDKLTGIDRLRLHVKDNILYYMQAIWSYEPPDQRFFRLYNIDVPVITANTAGVNIDIHPDDSLLAILKGKRAVTASLPLPDITVTTQKLAEVADLDTLLGYKGNYMIFGLKDNSYFTLQMMQDYLDVDDELLLQDPDEPGGYTVDELQELATCLYRKDPKLFQEYRDQLKQLLLDRLTAARPDNDLVIVPSSSLYIEALPGTHPLLEDFKLIHRALDVKKVQAEVRHAELENIRLASRALKGKDGDPDVDKKIVVEAVNPRLTIQPDVE